MKVNFQDFMNAEPKIQLDMLKNRAENGFEDAFFIYRVLNHFLKNIDVQYKQDRYEIINSLNDEELDCLINFLMQNNILKSSKLPQYCECLNGLDGYRLNKIFENTDNLVILRNSLSTLSGVISKLEFKQKINLYIQILYTQELKTSFVNTNFTVEKNVKNNIKFKKSIFSQEELNFIENSELKDFFKFIELSLNNDILNNMLKNNKFPSKIKALMLSNEEVLLSVCKANVDIFNKCILNDKEILRKISQIPSSKDYLKIVKNLEEKNAILDLILMREDFYNEAFKKESEFSKEALKEFFFERYFQDSAKNVILNIKTILNFAKFEPNNKLNKNHLQFYIFLLEENIDFVQLNAVLNKIRVQDNFSIESLFKSRNDFYDDFTYVKEHSAKDLINNLTTEENLKSDEDLTKALGHKVYILNGDPFKMMIHCTKASRTSSVNNQAEFVNSKWNTSKTHANQTISLSLIGDDKFFTYKDISQNVTLVFAPKDLSNQQFLSINNKDISSEILSLNGKDVEIKNLSTYLPFEKFYDSIDDNYSELVYSRDLTRNDIIKPSFILCADTITEADKSFADVLNLDIILVNTKKYNYNFEVKPTTLKFEKYEK